MKNYLSMGFGRNSVAMYLNELEKGTKFEAVFVDHGCDWPETYEYAKMFMEEYPVTILHPNQSGNGDIAHIFFDNLYDFSHAKKIFPSRVSRWCTDKFKRVVFNKYQESPCFVFIGYDYGERHRAKITSSGGREYRFPLIEDEINLEGCKEIIKRHGLPIPIKSGCYICPFQRVGQLRLLRKIHPDLFCKLERLENRNNVYRELLGKPPYYSFKKPVREIAERDIKQLDLFIGDEYPPCECGL